MDKFWKFENSVSVEGASDLYLDGDISSVTWWGDEVTPEAFRSELRKMKGNLTVHINSPGGDVFAGVTIYNALKDYSKGKVIVKVDGLAASIASVIAMAGDEIIMSPGSMIMVHNPWSMGAGNAEELRKVADTLEEIGDNIVPIYADRTGLSEDEVKELLDAETWLSAEKAVELGFADRIQKESKKEEKSSAKLLMANFAFNMSASKASIQDLINKVKNSERNPSMEEEPKDVKEEVVTAEEPEVEAPAPEAPEAEEPKAEVEEPAAEAEEPKEEEAKTEEEPEAPAEEENAEEGEKGEEEPVEEDKGDEVADGIEAKIKALQDKISALEEENNSLKEKMAAAEEKMSKQDALQARYSSILNMAEEADGGDVSGEKEEKQVDTYGDALKEAFQEI